MSRQVFIGQKQEGPYELGHLELEAQEAAGDLFALGRAKEVLTELEKQGRITTGLREQGIVALSAAIKAIEHPYMRNLGTLAGLRASTEQYEKEKGARGRGF